VAFRIAAHVADVVKLGRRARSWDDEVSRYRGGLMWREMISKLIYPERAWSIYAQYGEPKVRGCTMCGGYCPMLMALQQARRASD